jgi:hypothetical protein
MSDSFGARLRKHRQQRQIPLRTIAEQTKIKLSMLEGLEKDDISQWPAGIFRRAYVRSYANAVGLDVDAVIREFLELYPEQSAALDTPVEQSGPAPTRFRTIVESALTRFRRTKGPETAPPVEVRESEVATPVEPVRAIEAAPMAAAPIVPQPGVRDRSVATSGRGEPKAPDWLAAARVCTELGRVERLNEVRPLLRDAAGVLGAAGVIVWVWDATAAELRVALGHGYSNKALARMRGVARDADNLTAASFRSGETLAVSGEGKGNGALAVPLLAPAECVGVFAIELPRGDERSPAIRAAATFFAAMLAQLFAGEAASSPSEAVPSPPASPSVSRPPSDEPSLQAYPGDHMLPATSR